MGVNGALYKSLTFGVSAAYTGVAGALSALAIAFVAPDAFNVFLSITFLVGIVIGGLAAGSGAIFGGVFVQLVPHPGPGVFQAPPPGLHWIFLVVFMFALAPGLAGGLR